MSLTNASSSDKGSESDKRTPSSSSPDAKLDSQGKDNAADANPPVGDSGEKDTDRFDKHPRFQELNAKAKAAEERANVLQERLARLEGQMQQASTRQAPPAKEEPKLDFVDVMSMKPEEISEKVLDDPIMFYGNLARQIKHEVATTLAEQFSQQTTNDRIANTYNSFADANPEFSKMWDSGAIGRYMERNPGHNAISAYFMLTGDSQKAAHESALTKAREEATAEAEKKFMANLKAKGQAGTIASSPTGARAVNDTSDELKNPKKYGGATAVLAARHAARMSQGK